jgi:hypothetical protein
MELFQFTVASAPRPVVLTDLFALFLCRVVAKATVAFSFFLALKHVLHPQHFIMRFLLADTLVWGFFFCACFAESCKNSNHLIKLRDFGFKG